MKKRKMSLDMIRVLAISLIVAYHFFIAVGFGKTRLCRYANGGWGSVGACIFFVLSGYLLAGKDLFTPVKNFYRKRAASLFPLMDFMFVVFYLIYSIHVKDFLYGGSFWKWPLSLIGIDSYLGFYNIRTYAVIGEWFTAVILIAYLVFPVLRVLYQKYFRQTTVLLTAFYFLNVIFDLQGGVTPDACFITGVFLFWTGMTLYRFNDQAERNPLWLVIGLIAAVVVVFVKLPVFPGRGSSLPWKDLLGISLFVIMLQIFAYIHEEERVQRAFRALSGLSFGVYLCHHFLIYRLQNVMQEWIGGGSIQSLDRLSDGADYQYSRFFLL